MTHVYLCVPVYYTPARLAYLLHPICMSSVLSVYNLEFSPKRNFQPIQRQ
jgi:hypothetical protein